MIYLSCLRLNLRSPRVRAELRDPYEMHRTLAKAFVPDGASGDSARASLAAARVLFRAEDAAVVAAGVQDPSAVVLVQSRVQPDWVQITVDSGYFVQRPECKALDLKFRPGQRLAFRLRANPTVKREGKRYGLYGEDEQISWLGRKAVAGGFALERAVPTVADRTLRTGPAGHAAEFLAVRYDGVLRVTDPSRFAQQIEAGIGCGKGFGFGLLSVAPA